MKLSKDEYMNAVQSKIRENSDVLRFGPVPNNGKNSPIRDSEGMMVTFSNILKIGENLYDRASHARYDGIDAVAQEVSNFSGAGFADVSKVQTVGAIDVTILLLANSLIPFLAVDRSMNNPSDTVYYSDLVAVNTAGGVNAGDIVIGNFLPPNTAVTTGPAKTSLSVTVPGSTTSEILNFSAYLVPGNTVVVVTRGSSVFTGQDFQSDGNIYFNGGGMIATVDYVLGQVNVASGLLTGDIVNAVVLLDVSKAEDGSGILRVKPVHTPVQLNTKPKNFVFEENEAANLYMARIQAQASKVGGLGDYRDLYFSRLTNLYIEDVNRDILRVIVQLGSAISVPVSLNLTNYQVAGSFAETKNDKISKFFIDLRTRFISKTGVAATVMITGTRGAAELENHPHKFVSAPSYYTQLNGFVGTFNSIPVYRHNYMDGIEGANTATYYMAAKLPDNSSGTMVFGEFLPLTQTATIGNFDNPTEKATGWFSQVGTQVIQSTLIDVGVITYGGTFGVN